MFPKSIPIIFVGLSVVVAVLVLSWIVFVKTEDIVPVEPIVVNDNNQNSKNDEVIDDSFDVDDVVVDDNDSEINISDTDISSWKTYRNEEYGFEIKHPENWDASMGEPISWHKDVIGKVYITGHSIKDSFYAPIAITILSNEKRLSIKKWYQEYYPNGDVSRLQEVKLGEVNGMRKLSLWSDGLDSFIFSNEDKIYSMTIMDLQENAENQIMMNERLLSTLKFIEPADNTIWKTYQNEEFGFKIEYPSTFYFFDCSKPFHSYPLYICLTPYVEDSCNTPWKAKASAISISIIKDFNKDNVINSLNKNIKEEEIIIGNKSAIQISGNREVMGDEGEKLSSAPIREMVYTVIPFKDNTFIEISYHRIVSIENNINGFSVGEDLSDAYNQILSIFKFIE